MMTGTWICTTPMQRAGRKSPKILAILYSSMSLPSRTSNKLRCPRKDVPGVITTTMEILTFTSAGIMKARKMWEQNTGMS